MSLKDKRSKGHVLLELIVVVMLIAIIASFAIPQFFASRQKAKDYEAKTILKLIQAAEKTYRLEKGSYRNCSNTANCNSNLDLNLPETEDWGYDITGAPSQFCIQATGT
ncbi:MAG: prepilin-type N-terminal cleavage/methylation domain-containing protein, partial [Candidatus Omnitrophota bacterium]